MSDTVKRLYRPYSKLLEVWRVFVLLYKRSVAEYIRDKEGVFIRKGSQFGAQMRTKKP